MFILNYLKKGIIFLILLLTITFVSACENVDNDGYCIEEQYLGLEDKLVFLSDSVIANLIVGQTEVYSINNFEYKVEFQKITDYRYLDHQLLINGQELQIDTSDPEKDYELADGSKFKLLEYTRIYEKTDRNINDDSMIIDFSISQKTEDYSGVDNYNNDQINKELVENHELTKEKTSIQLMLDYLKKLF